MPIELQEPVETETQTNPAEESLTVEAPKTEPPKWGIDQAAADQPEFDIKARSEPEPEPKPKPKAKPKAKKKPTPEPDRDTIKPRGRPRKQPEPEPETTPEPEAETEVEPEPEPEAPLKLVEPEGGLSDALIEEALGLGFTEDDLEGMTEKAVQRTLDLAVKQMKPKPQPKAEPAPTAAPEAKPEPKTEEPQTTMPRGVDEKMIAKLEESGVDPETINAFRSDLEWKKAVQNMNGNLVSELVSLKQEIFRVQHQRSIDQFDRYIAELGDEYREVLGKGPSLRLDPKSEQWTSRNEIYDTYVMLRNRSAENGRYPDEQLLFNRAVRAVLGEKQSEIETRVTKAQRRGRTLARPTSRQTANLPHGTHRAAESVHRWKQEHGLA